MIMIMGLMSCVVDMMTVLATCEYLYVIIVPFIITAVIGVFRFISWGRV